MERIRVAGVTFFLELAVLFPPLAVAATAENPPPRANVHSRDSLRNARLTFERSRKGHVAFIGGSITEMEGYRPLVCAILKRRFLGTRFTFTNAGISSTCSTTGAFRLPHDVLGDGPVDLLFVEFAVNDDQDAAHARRECIRGLEGIVRQARRSNPRMDIVITYFVNEAMMANYRQGKTPVSIAAHETVAEHYGIASIHLAKEVTEQIDAGKFTWAKYGGVHPAPFGNAICAGMIDELMTRQWSRRIVPGMETTAYAMPGPLDPLSYEDGHFVDPAKAAIKQGWKLAVPPWDKLKGATRPRFTGIPLLCAEAAGAELTLDFRGTAVGAFIVAGPDAGVVEASVDGAAPREVDLFHHFSAGLHYPRTVMLGIDLKPGRHTLVLRMSPKTHSAGHAMRIVQFAVNGPAEE